MTAPEFTPNGITVQTYQEAYQQLADGYRGIYGEDISLDPEAPDGQRVGIETRHVVDAQAFGALLYSQLDPDFAVGTALNRVLKFSGITRRAATRSQVDVTVTTARALTLPENYEVEDELGQVWRTRSAIDLMAGSNTVTLFAREWGAIEADADTVNKPLTIVLGVESVNNSAAALPGRDQETVEEVRIRRRRSLENPASSTVGGMFTVIGDLPGVTDLAIYENDSDSYDSELDLGAHSIWLVVEGGAVDEIVEEMAKNKTGGTPLKGDVSGTWTEELQKPNGDPYVIIHTMNFDRPNLVDVYVRLTATRKDPNVPVDTALIAQLLAERSFGIGDNVVASELYETGYGAGDTFILTDMEVSLDGSTWTNERVESGLDDKLVIDEANVTVTEVTP